MSQPDVSIITPTHNDADYLELALDAVAAQTHTRWEHWVIDDGSTEAMARRIKCQVEARQRQGYPVRLLRNAEPQGAAVARNRGIESATGRYIAFLDADDYWLPQKLERQLAFMREKNAPLSYTAYHIIRRYSPTSGEPVGKVSAPVSLTHAELLNGCAMGCLTVMYDTHALGKRYMPDLACSQDYALWLAILRDIDKAYGLDDVLAWYTRRASSLSANKWRKVKNHWHICRCLEGLSLPASLQSLIRCTSHSLAKRYL